MLLIVIFAIFAAIIVYVGVYVGVIKRDRSIKTSWHNIVSQSNRRRDLIPFLIRVIKEYNNEEDLFLEALQSFVEIGKDISTVEERALLESEITTIINTVFDNYSNFPDIMNDNNYLKLQKTFRDIEKQIEIAKNYYNENVLEFNSVIGGFPTNIIARKFNLDQRESFDYLEEYDYLDDELETDEEDTIDENANDAIYNNGNSEEFK